MVDTHIKINENLYQKAKRIATQDGRSFNNYVIRLICKNIEEVEKKDSNVTA